MSRALAVGMGLLLLFAVGCSASMHDPVMVPSSSENLDLRKWDFIHQGSVIPQGWLWDRGLWSPETGGRPDSLPPAQALGPPSQGGLIALLLEEQRQEGKSGQNPVSATAYLRILVNPRRNYGLRVGAFPGAMIVWANGVRVWESGEISFGPSAFVANGAGTLVNIQPKESIIELVVQFESNDRLVRHPELNRQWIVGPASPMLEENGVEQTWRALQTSVLLLGALLFMWISRLRPERRPLVYFVAFLLACLAKMLMNVEETRPLISILVPGIPLSFFLFLNHGLNMLPFPLMLLFLTKQFPQEIGPRSLQVGLGLTVVVTLWELLPFVLLALGFESLYESTMAAQWSLILNLYVVLMTLFIFERFYLVFQRKRPLSRPLFLGGIFIGIVVLLPIPLSYFLPVKFVYFLGWGMFLFLVYLSIEVVRDQVKTTRTALADLGEALARRQQLSRFVDQQWAERLLKADREDLRPGDCRTDEAIFVELHSALPLDLWLKTTQLLATKRGALLIECSTDRCLWALHAWPESALSFALVLLEEVSRIPEFFPRLALTQATVDYKILDAGDVWIPQLSGLPRVRLAELDALATRCASLIVLEDSLAEGLVIGGWRRHRRLGASSAAVELYEGEDPTLANLKDKNLLAFEAAVSLADTGAMAEAVSAMLVVVQANPFDQAARTLLTEWSLQRDYRRVP